MLNNVYILLALIVLPLFFSAKLVFANQIASKPKVLLPHSDNWRPYYFKNSIGEYVGSDFELLKTILQEMEHELRIVTSVPRKRIFSDVKEYHHNTLFAVTYNETRAKEYYFSAPYRTESIAVFSAKPGIQKFNNIEQVLASDNIGIMNMAAFFGADFERLKLANESKLMHSENSDQQINLLTKGRGDYIIGDVQHHKAMITHKNIKGILQSEYYVSQNPVHFIFLKTDFSPAFVKAFNLKLEQQLLSNQKHQLNK